MKGVEKLLTRQEQNCQEEIIEEAMKLDNIEVSPFAKPIYSKDLFQRETCTLLTQRFFMNRIRQLIPEDIIGLRLIDGTEGDIMTLSGHFGSCGAYHSLDTARQHGWMYMQDSHFFCSSDFIPPLPDRICKRNTTMRRTFRLLQPGKST